MHAVQFAQAMKNPAEAGLFNGVAECNQNDLRMPTLMLSLSWVSLPVRAR